MKEQTIQPKVKRLLVMWVVGGVVALVLVGIAFGAYQYGKKTSATATPSPSAIVIEVPSPSPEFSPSPSASAIASKKPSPSPTSKPSPTPTPSPTPVSQTLTFNSTAALDGWRSSDGGQNSSQDIVAGHNTTFTSRGFVSFDISVLPGSATIDSATLKLYQREVIGNPYTSPLVVDHVNYGSTWSATPYNGYPTASNIGTLSNNANLEWKSLAVMSSVLNDRAMSRTTAQFAIRFAPETMGVNAWARFVSADGSGNTPRLVVSYH